MFSKNKPDTTTPAPSSTKPAKTSGANIPSIISPQMTVTGNLVTTGDVQIDGTVDGDVQSENLTVGDSGTINGTVRAANLRVLGQINGEIHSDSVSLLDTARVRGDIVHDSLAIEAGALVEGHCRRREQQSTSGRSSASKTSNKPKNSTTNDKSDSKTDATNMPNGTMAAGE